ncbi:hypothetical protein MP228_000565 [Amoeboaphelidium protococcarum]|nr:hypothetical protein MP228_000565 [Amoeboaphelidium protococcarum]
MDRLAQELVQCKRLNQRIKIAQEIVHILKKSPFCADSVNNVLLKMMKVFEEEFPKQVGNDSKREKLSELVLQLRYMVVIICDSDQSDGSLSQRLILDQSAVQLVRHVHNHCFASADSLLDYLRLASSLMVNYSYITDVSALLVSLFDGLTGRDLMSYAAIVETFKILNFAIKYRCPEDLYVQAFTFLLEYDNFKLKLQFNRLLAELFKQLTLTNRLSTSLMVKYIGLLEEYWRYHVDRRLTFDQSFFHVQINLVLDYAGHVKAEIPPLGGLLECYYQALAGSNTQLQFSIECFSSALLQKQCLDCFCATDQNVLLCRVAFSLMKACSRDNVRSDRDIKRLKYQSIGDSLRNLQQSNALCYLLFIAVNTEDLLKANTGFDVESFADYVLGITEVSSEMTCARLICLYKISKNIQSSVITVKYAWSLVGSQNQLVSELACLVLTALDYQCSVRSFIPMLNQISSSCGQLIISKFILKQNQLAFDYLAVQDLVDALLKQSMKAIVSLSSWISFIVESNFERCLECHQRNEECHLLASVWSIKVNHLALQSTDTNDSKQGLKAMSNWLPHSTIYSHFEAAAIGLAEENCFLAIQNIILLATLNEKYNFGKQSQIYGILSRSLDTLLSGINKDNLCPIISCFYKNVTGDMLSSYPAILRILQALSVQVLQCNSINNPNIQHLMCVQIALRNPIQCRDLLIAYLFPEQQSQIQAACLVLKCIHQIHLEQSDYKDLLEYCEELLLSESMHALLYVSSVLSLSDTILKFRSDATESLCQLARQLDITLSSRRIQSTNISSILNWYLQQDQHTSVVGTLTSSVAVKRIPALNCFGNEVCLALIHNDIPFLSILNLVKQLNLDLSKLKVLYLLYISVKKDIRQDLVPFIEYLKKADYGSGTIKHFILTVITDLRLLLNGFDFNHVQALVYPLCNESYISRTDSMEQDDNLSSCVNSAENFWLLAELLYSIDSAQLQSIFSSSLSKNLVQLQLFAYGVAQYFCQDKRNDADAVMQRINAVLTVSVDDMLKCPAQIAFWSILALGHLDGDRLLGASVDRMVEHLCKVCDVEGEELFSAANLRWIFHQLVAIARQTELQTLQSLFISCFHYYLEKAEIYGIMNSIDIYVLPWIDDLFRKWNLDVAFGSLGPDVCIQAYEKIKLYCQGETRNIKLQSAISLVQSGIDRTQWNKQKTSGSKSDLDVFICALAQQTQFSLLRLVLEQKNVDAANLLSCLCSNASLHVLLQSEPDSAIFACPFVKYNVSSKSPSQVTPFQSLFLICLRVLGVDQVYQMPQDVDLVVNIILLALVTCHKDESVYEDVIMAYCRCLENIDNQIQVQILLIVLERLFRLMYIMYPNTNICQCATKMKVNYFHVAKALQSQKMFEQAALWFEFCHVFYQNSYLALEGFRQCVSWLQDANYFSCFQDSSFSISTITDQLLTNNDWLTALQMSGVTGSGLAAVKLQSLCQLGLESVALDSIGQSSDLNIPADIAIQLGKWDLDVQPWNEHLDYTTLTMARLLSLKDFTSELFEQQNSLIINMIDTKSVSVDDSDAIQKQFDIVHSALGAGGLQELTAMLRGKNSVYLKQSHVLKIGELVLKQNSMGNTNLKLDFIEAKCEYLASLDQGSSLLNEIVQLRTDPDVSKEMISLYTVMALDMLNLKKFAIQEAQQSIANLSGSPSHLLRIKTHLADLQYTTKSASLSDIQSLYSSCMQSIGDNAQSHACLLQFNQFCYQEHQRLLQSHQAETLQSILKSQKTLLSNTPRQSMPSADGQPTEVDKFYHKLNKQHQHDQILLEEHLKLQSQFLSDYVDSTLRLLSSSRLNKNGYRLVVFRFLSVWNEIDDADLMKSIHQKLDNVVSGYFVSVVNQLCAMLSSESKSSPQLQKSVAKVLLKLLNDHYYHSMWPVLASYNSAIDNGQGGAIVDLIQQMQTDGQSKCLSILNAGLLFTKVCVDISNLPSYKRPSQCTLSSIVTKECVKKLQSLPIPVQNVAVDYSQKYLDVDLFSDIERQFQPVGGLSKPKKICVQGKSGLKYNILLKRDAELRQEAILQSIFVVVNDLVRSRDNIPDSLKSFVRTYNIVPLNQNIGVIEWLDGTSVVGEHLSLLHEKYFPQDWKSSKCIQYLNGIVAGSKVSSSDILSAYLDVEKKFTPAMKYHFFEKLPLMNAAEVWRMRLNYSKSVASNSMVGYIFGIGDRHPFNILLDDSTGEQIHIDLGVAFNAGELLRFPEVVPFRLTRDIIDGMGLCGVNGPFMNNATKMLDILRDGREELQSMLEVLRIDPLYSWAPPVRKNIIAADDDPCDQENLPIRVSRGGRSLRSDRNEQFISMESVRENSNVHAQRVITRVKDRLQARDSADYLVRDLIRQATDVGNLSIMFPGWHAFM